MSEYFSASSVPAFGADLDSATIRAEFAAVQTGFGKFPTLSGNGDAIVKINSGGTALESVATIPVAQGGTGSATASAARTALGLAIGSDVQAHSARLDEIAALTPSDSNFIVGDGSSWVAEGASAARTSLGLGDLATASNINNDDWSGADLAVANGGTGASSAGDARSNLGLGTIATVNSPVPIANGGTASTSASSARSSLGLAIGSDVQAHSARLDDIAALTPTDSYFIVGNGSTWVRETTSTVRTSLGLGSLATLSSISDSNWSGTDLAIANGGTGSSTASGARSNLGLGTLATLSSINNGNWSGTDLAVGNGGTGASSAGDARTNLGLGSMATRNVTISTNAPSGGSNDDIWFRREA